MTPRARAAAVGIAAALAVASGCTCEAPPAEPTAPPARPPEPNGPATVAVVQALPAAPEIFGWLDDRWVLILSGDLGFVWDPESGHIVRLGPERRIEGAIQIPWAWQEALGENEFVHRDDGRMLLHERFADPAMLRSLVEDREVWRRELTRDDAVLVADDGRRALVCGPSGVVMLDATNGSTIAERAGAVVSCAWEGSAIAAMRENDVVVLDAATLTPIGAPVTDVRVAAPSADGRLLAIVVWGSREGVSVIDLETRAEVMHQGMPAPLRLRIIDDAVFHGDDHSAGVLALRDGRVIVPPGQVAWPAHLASEGRVLARDGDDVVVLDVGGDVIARPTAAVWAHLSIEEDVGLTARSGSHRWAIGDGLEARRLGTCPERIRDIYRSSHLREVATGRRRAMFDHGCVGHDDGTVAVGAFAPVAIAEDGTFLAESDGRLQIHDRDGEVRARVALDAGESAPCDGAMCLAPITFSPDGTFFVVAQGPRLRTFDATSGALIGDAAVVEVTLRMSFFGEGLLLHDGYSLDDGSHGRERTVWSVPSLRRRGRFDTTGYSERAHIGPLEHALGTTEGEIVEVTDRVVRRRSATGRVLREVTLDPRPGGIASLEGAVATARGDAAAPIMTVLAWPELTVVGDVPGRFVVAGGHDLVTCHDGHLHRATLADGDLHTRELDVPCGEVVVVGDGVLVAFAEGRTVLVRADDAVVELVGMVEDDRLVLSGFGTDVVIGTAPAMLAQPSLTAAGMIDMPRSTRTLADWIAGP